MTESSPDEIQHLRAAADAGDVEACVELADILSRSGDEAMKTEALVWYERATNLGDVLSMATLGGLLEQGWGAPVNLAAAATWYAKAAAGFEAAIEADDAFTGAAMSALAKQLLAGAGVPPDPERAIALYESAAARGFHWALIHLGAAYEEGLGIPQDLERARRAYERAIAAGADSYARDRLHDLDEKIHQAATTEPVGDARVPSELLRAAEAGDPQKMWELARLLETAGESEAAAGWMRRAAEAGHAVAAFTMILLCESDEDRARWRRRAAGLGHITALHMMGDFWLESDQGAADPGYGYAWLALATRERHAEPTVAAARLRAQATQRASDVWAELTADQRARASDLLARCDAGPPHKLPDEV